jgi:hypothetical protein
MWLLFHNGLWSYATLINGALALDGFEHIAVLVAVLVYYLIGIVWRWELVNNSRLGFGEIDESQCCDEGKQKWNQKDCLEHWFFYLL